MKRCFFIGHRDAPDEIMMQLIQKVKQMIEEETVMEFVIGEYGKFDHMAAEAVMQAKKEYGGVKLILLTPYHPAERPLTKPDGFDEIVYPFDALVPSRIAIVRANERMIQRSSHLIAYVCRPGKARDFLEYAKKKKIRIEQIGR